jgi:HD-GYP domain-containing protein (c-di-GMP phosphodiesterase class II)
MADENIGMLDLLQDLSHKVGEVSELSQLVEHTVKMCRRALKADAASVLLYDVKSQDLYFEVAQGKAGKVLRKISINSSEGIAGWVFGHGSPLIVNDVSQDPRFSCSMDNTSGFITRSIICVPLIVHRKTIGVLEVLNKLDGGNFTEQDREILESLASLAAIALENNNLHKSVLAGYKSTIEALASAIDAKDPSTCGHSRRVMEYALMCGRELLLPKKNLEVLEYAGLLHDIGKIGISENILRKPAALTGEEYNIIRSHSLIGGNILKDIPFLEEARGLVLHHHERFDGTGYPDGLRGEEIPMGARLLAVADTFDTMTTDRYYRAALSEECAITEIKQCSGSQFCPLTAQAFVSAYYKRAHKNRLALQVMAVNVNKLER